MFWADRRSPKITRAAKAEAPGLRANIGDTVEISILRSALATNRKENAARKAEMKMIANDKRVIFEKSMINRKGREKTKLRIARDAEKLVE